MAFDFATALFSPQSVALIGVSDDPTRVSGRPLAFLKRHGYAGAIWPVNPARETVQGVVSYPSVAALPECPDIAFVLLAAEAALEAVQACVTAEVPTVVVLADGFAEAGHEGRRREEALRALVAGSRTRLLGPQSIGLVDTGNGLSLTANAAFAEPSLLSGSTMLMSHSGSMIGAVLSRSAAQGIGWRRLVSVGNEMDLSIGEIGGLCVGDSRIDSFALFLETIRDRPAFIGFCDAASAAGKPIAALRMGRTAVGQALAQTHTGAMLADGAATDAFLRDCGVCLVRTLDGLIHAPAFLTAHKAKPERKGVAIVTTTGGGGGLAAEALSDRQIPLYTASQSQQKSLRIADLPAMNGPVLDVTLAGTRPATMREAITTVAKPPSGENKPDLVLAVIGSSARFSPDLAVEPLIAAASTSPMTAMLMPDAPEATKVLQSAQVPVFPGPEVAADVLGGWYGRRSRHPTVRTMADQGEPVSEVDAAAFSRLRSLDISVADYCIQSIETTEFSPDLPFPIVLKGILAGVEHRTDAGLVHVDIADADTCGEAIEELRRKDCRAVLVMAMERGVAEVLVGYAVDPVAGPVIMVAPGGVLAELYEDRSIRTAPVDRTEALSMIDEVRGLATIHGYRNMPAGDIGAVADAIVALSGLAASGQEAVRSAEINPLIVKGQGQGAVAVDALFVTTGDP